MTLPLLIAALAGFVVSGAVYILWTLAENRRVQKPNEQPSANEPAPKQES